MLSGGHVALSTITSLAFAMHPVHVESVANVAHFAEMICCSFYLLCQMAFMRSCKGPKETDIPLLTLSAVCYFLSSMAKEIGLTAIGVTTIWSAVFLLPGSSSTRVRPSSDRFPTIP